MRRPSLPAAPACQRISRRVPPCVPPCGRSRQRAALVGALALLAACERSEPPPRPAPPPVVVAPPPAAPAVPAPEPAWNPDAGVALVVPGEAGEALIVVPGGGTHGGASAGGASADTVGGRAADVLPGEVALFTRAGAAGHAQAAGGDAVATASAPEVRVERSACTDWPVARLGPASGGDPLPSWTVGFVGATGDGAPAPLPLDSLEALTTADSAAVAAAVTRLAAALPRTHTAAFRGLPFTVRNARRFAPDAATQAVVAVLGRGVNQEASPLAEHILLVAERPRRSAGRTSWTVAYHERVTGREETLPVTDVLAAVQVGPDRRATLVLVRELDAGSRYTLLERTGPGEWRARWTSVVRGGCRAG